MSEMAGDHNCQSTTAMNGPATSEANDHGFAHNDGSSMNDTPTETYIYSHLYSPAPSLASSRYNRQMLIPSISLPGQEKIASAKVLIIGLGGLGAPAALYLAGAGVGKLGLLDSDHVELTNLHRQIVHRESSVSSGMTKVQSAINGCRELNSDIELVPHEIKFDVSSREKAEEVLSVVEGYDIVLDCTDNPATRYLISDLCVLLGKALVSGAAQRLEGQITVLNYVLPNGEGRGPCYRCVFPTPPSPEMVKGCGEIGILGPVVGTIGTLMASEALRLVVKGVDESRKPSMLMYNAWATDPRSMFRSFGIRGRRTDCIGCGDTTVLQEKGLTRITKEEILHGRVDYVAFCGVVQDIKLLKEEERVSAVDFLNAIAMQSTSSNDALVSASLKWHRPLVVDVREPHEIEMGPRIKLGVNVPISRILRQDSAIAETDALIQSGRHDAMLFVCQQGNDSQIAAKKLLEWRNKANGPVIATVNRGVEASNDRAGPKIFIGDIIGGYAALDRVCRR